MSRSRCQSTIPEASIRSRSATSRRRRPHHDRHRARKRAGPRRRRRARPASRTRRGSSDIVPRAWAGLGEVDGDQVADRAGGPHHVAGEVVEDAAVDEQVAADGDRREDPGEGDAGPDRGRRIAAVVDLEARPGDVGRHAEERQPQVAQVDPSEHGGDVPADPPALHERDDRHGVVEQATEQLGGHRHQLVGPQLQRHRRAERRTDDAPPMASTSMPSSSSARHTPRWAKPRAPPPPSTSPVAVPRRDGRAVHIGRRAFAEVDDTLDTQAVGQLAAARGPSGASGWTMASQRSAWSAPGRRRARRPPTAARRRRVAPTSRRRSDRRRPALGASSARRRRPSRAAGSRGRPRRLRGARRSAGRVTDSPDSTMPADRARRRWWRRRRRRVRPWRASSAAIVAT